MVRSSLGGLRRGVVVAALAMAGMALATSPATAGGIGGDRPSVAHAPTTLTDAALRETAASRVLFGHQSVGWNIIDGLERIYGSRGVTGLDVVQIEDTVPAGSAGVFAHAQIGENGDPASKIRAFESLVSGNADRIQVALMKLCYVDVTAGTDVADVFATYAAAVDSLQQRFPDLVILHATVPLTVGSPEDNVARERYNALLRDRFGASGRVVDIAKTESTKPGGGRVSGTSGGSRYYSLWPGYASDDGHLNARGGKRVASLLVRTVALAR